MGLERVVDGVETGTWRVKRWGRVRKIQSRADTWRDEG